MLGGPIPVRSAAPPMSSSPYGPQSLSSPIVPGLAPQHRHMYREANRSSSGLSSETTFRSDHLSDPMSQYMSQDNVFQSASPSKHAPGNYTSSGVFTQRGDQQSHMTQDNVFQSASPSKQTLGPYTSSATQGQHQIDCIDPYIAPGSRMSTRDIKTFRGVPKGDYTSPADKSSVYADMKDGDVQHQTTPKPSWRLSRSPL